MRNMHVKITKVWIGNGSRYDVFLFAMGKVRVSFSCLFGTTLKVVAHQVNCLVDFVMFAAFILWRVVAQANDVSI